MKLYAEEEQSGHVRALERMTVSAISRVEVAAALWRKHRAGELSSRTAALMVALFAADLMGGDDRPRRFESIDVDLPILDRAASLVAAFPLRGYDAVQLASALAGRAADPGCDTFVCFDDQLRAAAAANGFALAP